MKKSFTYVTIAVLLGAALMFTPRWLFLTESKNRAEPDLARGLPEFLTNTYKESLADTERQAGITPHYPFDAISVGLMLTFSLIFAFIISMQIKRRVA